MYNKAEIKEKKSQEKKWSVDEVSWNTMSGTKGDLEAIFFSLSRD